MHLRGSHSTPIHCEKSVVEHWRVGMVKNTLSNNVARDNFKGVFGIERRNNVDGNKKWRMRSRRET